MLTSKKRVNLLFLVVALMMAITLTGCEEMEAFNAGASDQASHMVPAEYRDIAVPFEPHLNYINTDELLALYHDTKAVTSTARNSYQEFSPEWDFVIVDSRPAGRYNEGHINGAINIPDDKFDSLKHLLPTDKNKKIIFYCGGWHCALSPASANKAMNLGYTNVFVYQEGMDHGWNKTNQYTVITPEYLKTILTDEYMSAKDKPPVLIVDSRPFASYFKEHIPMAIVSDNPEPWNSRFSGLAPTNKETLIITYCGGFFCGKSHSQAAWLKRNGYKNVRVLAGGMPEYKKSGLPVFGTESSGSNFDISAGQPKYDLTPAEWKAKYDAGNALVVDVRRPDEIAASGLVKGAININSADITANPAIIAQELGKRNIPKNQLILIHCAAGGRAAAMPAHFVAQGYTNVYYLANSIFVSPDGTFTFTR